MSDGDLSAALPEPPPPRPARREAAIGEALRRFDGGAPAATTPAPRPRRIGRPQLVALAVAALVVAIGLPVWLTTERPYPTTSYQADPATDAAENALDEMAAADNAMAPAAPPAVIAPAEQPTTLARAGSASRQEAPAPVAPSPTAAPEPHTDNAVARGVATADAVPPPPPAPPPPPPAIAEVQRRAAQAPEAMADSAGEVVVTGLRASPSARLVARERARRGDWNACTLDDPGEAIAACRRFANPAAPGATGRAAALHADGLMLAWRGDLDGAIRAFDQAIALSPRLAIAWLNRGLAYRRQGDTARALADLDQAVRLAPSSARGYYQRSLLLREQGDARRADRDMAHAVALDPGYEAVAE